MRRFTVFGVFPRSDNGAESADEPSEDNEKRVSNPPPRFSAMLLAATRFFQLAYFVFAHYALSGFQCSNYFREDDGPWQPSRGQLAYSMRTIRWVQMQAFVVLVYHVVVLTAPCLWRMLRSGSRPSLGLAAIFGDGCALVALLNAMVLLDPAHEGYCHAPAPRGDFQIHSMSNLGRTGHDITRHGSVCRSLDLVFGLGGIIMVSYLLSTIVTIWRIKQLHSQTSVKVEQVADVERGAVQISRRADETRQQAPAQREHSPPPPYHPVISELALEPSGAAGYPAATSTSPRGRPSLDTMSSVGLEAYLVSDGWRAPEEPPEYSSRPPSLHNALS